MSKGKSGLVITAHPGDFVWRAGGAIALHHARGYRMKILCLSFGERGESQWAWKQAGVTLAEVKAQRKAEAETAAHILGAEIEFFDAGDYPLHTTPAMMERAIDVMHELNPSFVLTHSLEDPYNVDHPEATRFAQEARIIAQAAGHKPDPARAYAAPPVFLFEPHQPEHRPHERALAGAVGADEPGDARRYLAGHAVEHRAAAVPLHDALQPQRHVVGGDHPRPSWGRGQSGVEPRRPAP